jgi:hypothetical protein
MARTEARQLAFTRNLVGSCGQKEQNVSQFSRQRKDDTYVSVPKYLSPHFGDRHPSLTEHQHTRV